ncbi:hypothetical protein BRADI_4g20849v3 [Brachypodium distachyon]|uniref:Uncharacterized protein n=1 Tax=Brachypodium distachyon TaxID=15368 RepID=A0A0Q3L841_BRADI|nr:hypothetical protein BRADI_4g20849v3 [Brachypodium distachyon]
MEESSVRGSSLTMKIVAAGVGNGSGVTGGSGADAVLGGVRQRRVHRRRGRRGPVVLRRRIHRGPLVQRRRPR